MKRFHLSISTNDFDASLQDYSRRLGRKPCVIVSNRYALWRTEILNFSVSCKQDQPGGMVRHLGFEDQGIKAFKEEKDCNGIVWEYFSSNAQRDEIIEAFGTAAEFSDEN